MLIKSKRVLFYVSLVLIAIFLWETHVMYPLRMLAVFFHELSHILGVFLTGGTLREFALSPLEGGHVISSGGNPFVIATVGYLGSLFWGTLILLLSNRTEVDRGISFILGLLIVFVGFAFAENFFTVLFCLAMGGFLSAVGLFLPHAFNNVLLHFVGFVVMLYTPYDIITDVFLRNPYLTDAGTVAESFGGSPRFWGVIWLLISLLTITSVFLYVIRTPLPGEGEVVGEGFEPPKA